MKERAEGVLASAATLTVWLTEHAQPILQALITVLTFAWWVRLWWRSVRRKKVRRRASGDDR